MKAKALALVLITTAFLAVVAYGAGLGDEGLFIHDMQARTDSMKATPAVPASAPLFDFNPSAAGAFGWSAPGDSLTANGVALTLLLSCDEADVSGTNINCVDGTGATVAIPETAGSPAPTTGNKTYLADGTEGISFSSTGRYYQRAARTLVNGTDYVVEVLFRTSGSASRTLIANATGTGVAGFSLTTTSTAASLRLGDGTNNNTPGITALGRAGALNHVIAYIDDDNLCGVCANGTCGSATTNSAVGDWTSVSDTLGLAGFGGGPSSTYAQHVMGWRLWQCPVGNLNCLAGATNAADFTVIAQQRTAKIFGVSAAIASTDARKAPTTLTRANEAVVDVIAAGTTRALWSVGLNVPRVATRSAGGVAISGLLLEPQTTNLALQSETLGTTWTAIDVGDNILADAFVGPLLATVGDNIDGDNTGSSEHGVRQSITHTAATHTLSAWLNPGEKTILALRNNTVANAIAYFNTTACAACSVLDGDCAAAVGTVGAGVSLARAVPWPIDSDGDGDVDLTLCRASITYLGTVAAHNIDLLCASADNVLAYTDTGAAADCGFTGVEVEAFPTPTSYTLTTTASVIRAGDDVRYDGSGHYLGSPTTLDTVALCPTFDVETSSTLVSAGTSTTNYGRIGINATSDRPHTDGANAGAQWDFSGAAGDVADGAAHRLRDTWLTNDIEGFYDGATYGTDVVATLPTSASSFIYLGTRGSTAQQPACLISRVRLWNLELTPTAAP